MDKNFPEIVDAVLTLIKQAADVTSTQAPIVVQELWQYALFENVLGLVVGVLCIGITLWSYQNMTKADYDGIFSDQELWCIPLITFAVVATITLISSTLGLGKLLIAPRLYLLEYVRAFLH